MAEPATCTYRLDASDTITATGGDWVAFARENGAPELEAVIGRSVWYYVAGRSTRALYVALFQRVRATRDSVTLPFRCDSPHVFRFMELDVSAGPEGVLDLAGRLLRVQRRPYFRLLDRLVPRSSSTLHLCSVCKRVQLDGTEWMEAEAGARRLGLLAGGGEPPELAYTVCEDCAARAHHPA